MMNDIAHRLKIKSIAEYVEFENDAGKTARDRRRLAQGFLFGEPGPPPGLAALNKRKTAA